MASGKTKNKKAATIATTNAATTITSTAAQFPLFDIVTNDSDHHYANNKDKHLFMDQKGTVFKKIMKEWEILKNHLPDSIYVRVYEGRIDLLRAAIVGPTGTPYHDALFFFDISFPPKYPTQPPIVYFHSHGLRLNPNLYSSGKVCLSLINTWTGVKTEKWTPSKSTVLQLLVSLQGLVLNEKPYFNEPGYSKSNTPEKKWMDYNDNTFIFSCKNVMYTLRNPPKNFEDLVVEHFRARGGIILGALKAYGDGLMIVGSYRHDGSSCSSSSSGRVKVSKKFEDDAKKVYCELEKVLKEKGIYVGEIKEEKVEKRGKEEMDDETQLGKNNKQRKEEKVEEEKKKKKLVKKEASSTGSCVLILIKSILSKCFM